MCCYARFRRLLFLVDVKRIMPANEAKMARAHLFEMVAVRSRVQTKSCSFGKHLQTGHDLFMSSDHLYRK